MIVWFFFYICLIVKQQMVVVTHEKHGFESQLLLVTLFSQVIYFLWDNFLICKIRRITLGQIVIDTVVLKMSLLPCRRMKGMICRLKFESFTLGRFGFRLEIPAPRWWPKCKQENNKVEQGANLFMQWLWCAWVEWDYDKDPKALGKPRPPIT